MDSNVLLLIGVIAVAALVAIVLYTFGQRTDRSAATGLLSRETQSRDDASRREAAFAPPAATGRSIERAAVLSRTGSTAVVPAARPEIQVPYDADQLGVSRRQFLNRSITVSFLVSIGGFGASIIAFLWPSKLTGFGGQVEVGKLADILQKTAADKAPIYLANARTYLQPYPVESLEKAKAKYPIPLHAGLEQGLSAIYQKCPHLGCKVPWCQTSQWFECPCHGSQYNRVGEKKGGPAPRGMDHFPIAIAANGTVTVNTGLAVQGVPIGVNTTGQEAEGPHCVGGGH
jgi:cytochrome b6-f complex iron-sulfur subunit